MIETSKIELEEKKLLVLLWVALLFLTRDPGVACFLLPSPCLLLLRITTRGATGDMPGRQEGACRGGSDASGGRSEPVGGGQEVLDAVALRCVEGAPA